MSKLRRAALPVFLLAISFGFLMIRIGQESFFIDEVSVGRSCHEPTWEYIKAKELNPPVYFYLIRWWSEAFGTGHAALRTFSALCAAACAPVLFLVARELAMPVKWSLLYALLFIFSPMAYWYGQQARGYALLCLAIGLWLLFYLKALRRGNRVDLALLLLVMLFGISVHYYFAFAAAGGILTAAAVYMRAPRERRFRDLFLVHAVGAGACLGYIPLLHEQITHFRLESNTAPKLREILQVYLDVFPGGPFNAVPAGLQLAISIMLVSAAGLLAAKIIRPGCNLLIDHDDSHTLVRIRAAFILASAILPILLPILVSIWVKPIFYKERYSIVALPAYLLLVPAAFAGFGRLGFLRRAGFCTAFALFILPGSWYIARYWRNYQDFDWRGAIRVISTEWRASDAIAFSPAWLGNAYTDNGGRQDRFIDVMQAAAKGPRRGDPSGSPSGGEAAGRIWLFEWEQNPSEVDRSAVQRLLRERGRLRMDFPHIKMFEIY